MKEKESYSYFEELSNDKILNFTTNKSVGINYATQSRDEIREILKDVVDFEARRLRRFIPPVFLSATTPSPTGSSRCASSTALPTPPLPAKTSSLITKPTERLSRNSVPGTITSG